MLDKVKDIKKGIIHPDYILTEVFEPKKLIITPDGSQHPDLYMKVILVGKNVTDIVEGDIILSTFGNVMGFKIGEGSREHRYATMARGMVEYVVKPDNFIDPDDMAGNITI